MTIFNIIGDILFLKKRDTLTNIDSEPIFIPFMVSRWISMYSNECALKCNMLNKYLSLEKRSLFALFFNIFSKVPFKKIDYFKKKKEENTDESVQLYSKALELSKREIILYSQVLTSLKN
jgi:hypothetical protein